jgi:hypothetical protein
MQVIYILLAVSIVSGAAAYYGYQARAYNSRQLAAGLFVITVLLVMSFMLARGS